MTYPSTLTSFSNPIPTDRLNAPSHSSVETTQNTALSELQTYIGVNTGVNASAVGTLLYDIKAPGSNGGGHIQTPATGGTGQTTFMKGDVLVAVNSSTFSKLGVGINGTALVADSTAPTGVAWGTATGVVQSVLTLIPQSPLNKQFVSKSLASPSIATVGQIFINAPITVNKLTVLSGDAGTGSSTVDITLYQENGESSIFTVTTPAINSGGGDVNTLFTASVPSVALAPGNYYVMANTNTDGTDIRLNYWGNQDILATSVLSLNYVPSMLVLQGTYKISDGAPPASIVTTKITSVVSASGASRFNTLNFRLDN